MQLFAEDLNDIVRGKLGVTSDELTDDIIDTSRAKTKAELTLKKRVDYTSVTDVEDIFYIQEAVACYVGASLCSSLKRLLDKEVKTADLRWVKDKVDWESIAVLLLSEYEVALREITSVAVSDIYEDRTWGTVYTPERETI